MTGRSEGLDGVVAAHTILSDVDGEAGRLVVRGYDLEQLAGWTFEEIVALLWGGFFGDEGGDIAARLGAARVRTFAGAAALDAGLLRLAPIEAVRALTARVPDADDVATALELTAALAVYTAAVLRVRAGLAPVGPDPSLGHGADILRMMRGRPASSAEAAALDAYLVTVADHGFNASTFAARVAASTRAGLTSAVLAGLSALKGPLHGGAPGPVIDMLDDIGRPRDARAWLEAALDRGDRLMGFGHRIYRVRDPRADALKRIVTALGQGEGALVGRLAFAEAVENAALEVLRVRKPGRALQTNVELYTALLLEALAIPRDAFTCVFAMGRVAGWIAHACEQVQSGRLIRPQSRYVGPRPQAAA